jgi:hypothetical protein
MAVVEGAGTLVVGVDVQHEAVERQVLIARERERGVQQIVGGAGAAGVGFEVKFVEHGGVPDHRHRRREDEDVPRARTVPLEDGKGGEVDEWLASYELNDRTRPVEQDASAPVYYTESSRSVTFHFNDKDAVVHFTAEPNVVDEFSHSAKSYWSGISGAGDWLPFMISSSIGGIGS